ncbi:hypothetical protein BJX64DRAFT_62842 [Aspergillus heterothallicus]
MIRWWRNRLPQHPEPARPMDGRLTIIICLASLHDSSTGTGSLLRPSGFSPLTQYYECSWFDPKLLWLGYKMCAMQLSLVRVAGSFCVPSIWFNQVPSKGLLRLAAYVIGSGPSVRPFRTPVTRNLQHWNMAISTILVQLHKSHHLLFEERAFALRKLIGLEPVTGK